MIRSDHLASNQIYLTHSHYTHKHMSIAATGFLLYTLHFVCGQLYRRYLEWRKFFNQFLNQRKYCEERIITIFLKYYCSCNIISDYITDSKVPYLNQFICFSNLFSLSICCNIRGKYYKLEFMWILSILVIFIFYSLYGKYLFANIGKHLFVFQLFREC